MRIFDFIFVCRAKVWTCVCLFLRSLTVQSQVFIVFLSFKVSGISPQCNTDLTHFPLCSSTKAPFYVVKSLHIVAAWLKAKRAFEKVKASMRKSGKSHDEVTVTQCMNGVSFTQWGTGRRTALRRRLSRLTLQDCAFYLTHLWKNNAQEKNFNTYP